MEVDSVEKLSKVLISSAFQRCRMLGGKLVVFLKSTPPLVLISVSDTGIESTLEEFQDVKYQNDLILDGKWDGVICIETTGISENEIKQFRFDLNEVHSSKRLVRLPSETKNGETFSGTKVSFSIHDDLDEIETMISIFIQKILILKTPNVAIEISVDSGDGVVRQQNTCDAPPMHTTHIDCLKLGLEDYVSKHGFGKNLEIGTGRALSNGNQPSHGVVMEVIIITSETSTPDQAYGRRTEDIEDQDGVALLEWENLPRDGHIDIILHGYHQKVKILPSLINNGMDRSLTKKSVELALKELKEKNSGILSNMCPTKDKRRCNLCQDRIYKTKNALKKHYKDVHGDLSKICSNCGHHYRTSVELQLHECYKWK